MPPIDDSVPTRGVNSNRPAVRQNFVAIKKLIGQVPEDGEGMEGRVAAIAADGRGLAVEDGEKDFAKDTITGGLGTIDATTGARLLGGDQTGRLQLALDTAPVAWALDAEAPLGTQIPWKQARGGVISFVPETGAALENFSGHTKSAGQHACGMLAVWELTTGGKAKWTVTGNTAP